MGQQADNAGTTIATQQFLEFSAQEGNIKIHVHFDQASNTAHLDITQLDTNNAVAQKFEQTIDLFKDHWQFDLASLDLETQQITQLLEAGLIFGLYCIMEEHCLAQSNQPFLRSVLAQKENTKKLVTDLIKQLNNQKLLASYPTVPTNAELFLEKYASIASQCQATQRPWLSS